MKKTAQKEKKMAKENFQNRNGSKIIASCENRV